MKQGKAQVASDPAAAAATLSEALSLWRADALADVTEEPSLRGEAARLEELRLSATEHRVSAEIAMGGHSTVVPELESLTARYPLRERMWANLMLALYRSGRQAEALSTFERARQVLADELGADPSQELQRLHEQILHRAPELGASPPASRPRPAVRSSRVDLQPGTEVAGYRIERTLGRGGMSVVYLAEHDWLQRKVALKVLAPQLAEDERFRERFVRESRLAASLDHPNVIPIFEAGASGADLFIAMRYVEGTDLRTLLHEGGALEPDRAIAIVRQVAAALDAAHEQGLVHRDVKPGNVLLARQRGSEAGEHVYLSDFGLTKRSASDSGITGTGQFVGTLDYAAPEQFKGGTPDARTDVYSLGCVLFECLTGRPPFTSENDAGLMYAHLQEPPPTVTADRPELPQEIDGVIGRAMAKAPDDRPESAGALVDEATRALDVGGSRTTDGSSVSASRLRRLVPIIAVATALVVGIVVTSLVQNETPGAAAGATSQPPADDEPQPDPGTRVPNRAAAAQPGRGAFARVHPSGRKRRVPAPRSTRTGPGRARRPGLRCRRRRGSVRAVPDARRHGRRVPAGRERPASAPRRVRHRHTRGGHVCHRRRAGRSGSVLHGRSCHERSRLGPAAGPVPYRMDGRQQLDLRACGPERPRGPQPVRLVALGLRPDRVGGRRDGNQRPAGLTRTSTSRRVLPDFAHGTPGEPFRLLGPVPPRGDVGCPSSRRHL